MRGSFAWRSYAIKALSLQWGKDSDFTYGIQLSVVAQGGRSRGISME